METAEDSGASGGNCLASFDVWRIHVARQQLARVSSSLLCMQLGFTVFYLSYPPLSLAFGAQPDDEYTFSAQCSSTGLLLYTNGFFTLALTILLASPWLRQRPDHSIEKYLNPILLLYCISLNVEAWVYALSDPDSRPEFLSGHVIDGLWMAIVLSMFAIREVWYYGILVGQIVLWTVTHFWLSGYDMSEIIINDIVCVLVLCFFCTVSWHSRMGTLRDCYEMAVLKQKAEDGYKRFLSYMMHEMRNPIGGAMFLLDDLENSHRCAGRGPASGSRTHSGRFLRLPHHQKSEEEGKGGGSPDSVASSAAEAAAFLHRKIRASLESMKSVCDDVLTLEKTQQRGFEYVVTTCDPLCWVKEVSDLERFSMTAEKIDFKVNGEIAPDLDESFAEKNVAAAADWLHLRQVAVNFLSNARKFTKEKGIVTLDFQVDRLIPSLLPTECVLPETTEERGQTLTALRRGQQPQQSPCDVVRSSKGLPKASDVCGWVRVELRVTDTGAGLSEHEMSKLFLPYSQIRAGELQRGGGTGLGLCISKMFVEAHWVGRRGGSKRNEEGEPTLVSVCLEEPLLPIEKRWSMDGDDAKKRITAAAAAAAAAAASRLLSPCGRGFASPDIGSRRRQQDLSAKSSRSSQLNLGGNSSSRRRRFSEQQNMSESEYVSPFALSPDGSIAPARGFLPELEEIPSGMPPKMAAQVRAYATDFNCLVVDDIWVDLCLWSVSNDGTAGVPWMCLTGERAVDVVRSPGAVERLQVILMDKDMPGLDGPETIRQIRSVFAQRGASLPLTFGITGEVAGAGMNALREAGADVRSNSLPQEASASSGNNPFATPVPVRAFVTDSSGDLRLADRPPPHGVLSAPPLGIMQPYPSPTFGPVAGGQPQGSHFFGPLTAPPVASSEDAEAFRAPPLQAALSQGSAYFGIFTPPPVPQTAVPESVYNFGLGGPGWAAFQ
uniref:histidine kinase n=1 Tax=Chromera velia CCMP2878 TaxID=1169474 RepID=A0A0G4HGC7_9ALVE|eukprot:Cvel_6753.t1-p1 / transcript=Cvel_6753.t1 / gene=Cvel_6753 / organism=Chromera_velia_CCMP2878 / gene_product=hypothetical protein / transcript_product=hypothetical protein / location=Cvel_scaffold338:34748-54656(-) / protein_length=945 / sequence_SO=supercontig / SO=protein_coding / is_pseudo=false